jgi:hypothetical protein
VGVARAVHEEVAEEQVEEGEVGRRAKVFGAGAGDLEFVEGLVGGFVDAWGLGAGADVGAGESVAEGGVVLEIADDRVRKAG